METYIHESSNIYDSAEIGEGTRIGAFVEIGHKVKIGKNCRIGCGSFIPENIIIEDNVFIGPHTVFTNDKNPPSNPERRKNLQSLLFIKTVNRAQEPPTSKRVLIRQQRSISRAHK